MKKISILLFYLALPSALFAQAQTLKQNLVWYSYFITIPVNSQWSVATDIQERHFIAPFSQHQSVIRSQIRHSFNNSHWDISAGMCFFLQSPNVPNAQNALIIPELRPHLETGYKHKWATITFDHRLRAEARFFHQTNIEKTQLSDGYAFGNFRFRYKFLASIPLVQIKDERKLSLKLSNEIMFNAGRNITTNSFDQNRAYAGINFALQKNLQVEAGYIHLYQFKSSVLAYERHIARFSVYHTLDFRRKKKS